MQVSLTSLEHPVRANSRASFAVHYADGLAARQILAQPGNILAVIGYGAAQPPDFLPPFCPFAAAPLVPVTDGAMFEIWTSKSPVRAFALGRVNGSVSDALAFGAVEVDEAAHHALEPAVEQAYLKIFDFLDAAGMPAPLRFWNYLTDITGDENGLERYRRFNIGRQAAFTARLRQALPPAASGVGGHHGASMIYFLAGREAPRAIENPRQVSAYDYPAIYGPRSPSFSRASATGQSLFISGTASITGHETRHVGDLPGQVAETVANLRALIGGAGPTPATAEWASKIYLHDPAYREAVESAIDTLFGAGSPRLYLHGDLCRTDLLVEIEAFRQG